MAEVGSRAQQPDATPLRLEDFSDPDRYPLVSAVVPHLRANALGPIFDFGMNVIFDAMHKDIEKPKRVSAGARHARRPRTS